MLGIHFASVSMIFRLDLGTVLKVWYFLAFILSHGNAPFTEEFNIFHMCEILHLLCTSREDGISPWYT